MKKLLSLFLALTLLLSLSALTFAAPAADALVAMEAMERFLVDNGKLKLTENLNLGYDDIPWRYFYIDFDCDDIPELVRCYMRDALQCSMDIFAAKKLSHGGGVEKVASFVDDGYHLFGGGTDRLYRLGRFADGTYGVSCFMPVYAEVNDGEALSETTVYYAYRDGAFSKTAENGFDTLDVFYTGPFAYYAPEDFSACVSAQKLIVDGKEIFCEKYNILGSNYFKLRDVAMLLNGTQAQFSVGWDGETGVVNIAPGESYVPVGGELTPGADKSASAVPSAQTILVNGFSRSDLSVFNLDGNNFFKLRDLGAALGFRVEYAATKNAAVIDTSPRRSTLKDGDYHLLLKEYTDSDFREEGSGIYCNVVVVEFMGEYDEYDSAPIYEPTGEKGVVFLPGSLRILNYHFVEPVIWSPMQLRENVDVLSPWNYFTVTITNGDVTAFKIEYHP